jgi:hypothetical protein
MARPAQTQPSANDDVVQPPMGISHLLISEPTFPAISVKSWF